jgi:hypothetical protein
MFGLMRVKTHNALICKLSDSLVEAKTLIADMASKIENYHKSIDESMLAKLRDDNARHVFLLRLCNWQATIEADNSNYCGNDPTFHLYVSFRPQLKRPGEGCGIWGESYTRCDPKVIAHENEVVGKLIGTLGVPSWETERKPVHNTPDAYYYVLKRKYYPDNFWTAVDDITMANDILQVHLDAALKEQTYRDIMKGE